MNTDELQKKIQDLANYSPRSEAEWVERVKLEPIDVLVGVIYAWQGGGGVMASGDVRAAKREALRAMVEARLTEQLERSASRIQWIGIAVAIVGVIVALIQVFRA